MPLLGLLLGGGVLAVGLLALIFARLRGGPSTDDLGPISEQWIAQHKARSRDAGP